MRERLESYRDYQVRALKGDISALDELLNIEAFIDNADIMPAHKAFLRLRFIDGMKTKEIAQTLGFSVKYVKKLSYKIFRKIGGIVDE